MSQLKETKQAENGAKEKREIDRSSGLSPELSKDRNVSLEKDRYGHDQEPKLDKAHEAYFRFKDLKEELHRSPDKKGLHKELKKAGMAVFKDREIFAHIESVDSKAAREIQKIARDLEKERLRAIERAKELDRGGYSL